MCFFCFVFLCAPSSPRARLFLKALTRNRRTLEKNKYAPHFVAHPCLSVMATAHCAVLCCCCFHSFSATPFFKYARPTGQLCTGKCTRTFAATSPSLFSLYVRSSLRRPPLSPCTGLLMCQTMCLSLRQHDCLCVCSFARSPECPSIGRFNDNDWLNQPITATPARYQLRSKRNAGDVCGAIPRGCV